MLSLMCYYTLARSEALSAPALRYFFNLLIEHDLRKPHAFPASEHMSQLVSAGVIEDWSSTRGDRHLYRLRPEMWLASASWAEAITEMRELREQDSLTSTRA